VIRSEVEEIPPLPGILRASDLSCHGVHNSEVAIAEEATIGDFGGVQLLAHHRLHRIAPQRGHNMHGVPPKVTAAGLELPRSPIVLPSNADVKGQGTLSAQH